MLRLGTPPHRGGIRKGIGMRVERHGPPPDLQAVFRTFVRKHLGGRSLDDDFDNEAAKGKFPDFACFRDLVLIEMKHLETDQSSRVNQTLHEKMSPDEMPIFFGERDINMVTALASNRDAINNAIFNKLSRTIESILSTADKQFLEYRARHPRKNSVSVCVILNSRLREFSPDVVAHALHSKMKTSRPGGPRFSEIDAILYISEKHMRMLSDGRPSAALVIYEGAAIEYQPWKLQVVDRVVDAWSRLRSGSAAVESDDPYGFEVIHDIPEMARRSEAYKIEYRRRPYLSGVSFSDLKAIFHRSMAVNSLAFINGNWIKSSPKETERALRKFSHILEEINRRGIDMRTFSFDTLSPRQQQAVWQGLPAELVTKLKDSLINFRS
jgi:hypothetical protein